MRGNRVLQAVILGAVVLLVLVIFSVVNGGHNLPKGAQRVFAKYALEMEPGSEYHIDIARKAKLDTGNPDIQRQITFTGNANAVSGCPDISGSQEVWCVVLEKPVAGCSHFVLTRSGGIWRVEPVLAENFVDVFKIVGCENWE
jgi:hypothetical protein